MEACAEAGNFLGVAIMEVVRRDRAVLLRVVSCVCDAVLLPCAICSANDPTFKNDGRLLVILRA